MRSEIGWLFFISIFALLYSSISSADCVNYEEHVIGDSIELPGVENRYPRSAKVLYRFVSETIFQNLVVYGVGVGGGGYSAPSKYTPKPSQLPFGNHEFVVEKILAVSNKYSFDEFEKDEEINTTMHVIDRLEYCMRVVPPLRDNIDPTITKYHPHIQIPLYICFLDGGPASEDNSDNNGSVDVDLSSLLGEVNETWRSADISFVTSSINKFPIVPSRDVDLQPRLPDRFHNRGYIDAPLIGGPTTGPILWERCATKHGNNRGIILVFVRGYYAWDGKDYNPAPQIGLAASLNRDIRDSVCDTSFDFTPLQMRVDRTDNVPQVRRLWVTVKETATSRTLSHELGHALYLHHGNGFDDDGNGSPAGMKGRKRFDYYCDQEERRAISGTCEQAGSLMSISGGCSILRPLQVDIARHVASVYPGVKRHEYLSVPIYKER